LILNSLSARRSTRPSRNRSSSSSTRSRKKGSHGNTSSLMDFRCRSSTGKSTSSAASSRSSRSTAASATFGNSLPRAALLARGRRRHLGQARGTRTNSRRCRA
jgi:hypothetical protein